MDILRMNETEYTTFDKIAYSIDFTIKAVCFIAISPLCIAAIPFSPFIYYHLKQKEKETKEHSEYMNTAQNKYKKKNKKNKIN